MKSIKALYLNEENKLGEHNESLNLFSNFHYDAS